MQKNSNFLNRIKGKERKKKLYLNLKLLQSMYCIYKNCKKPYNLSEKMSFCCSICIFPTICWGEVGWAGQILFCYTFLSSYVISNISTIIPPYRIDKLLPYCSGLVYFRLLLSMQWKWNIRYVNWCVHTRSRNLTY